MMPTTVRGLYEGAKVAGVGLLAQEDVMSTIERWSCEGCNRVEMG